MYSEWRWFIISIVLKSQIFVISVGFLCYFNVNLKLRFDDGIFVVEASKLSASLGSMGAVSGTEARGARGLPDSPTTRSASRPLGTATSWTSVTDTTSISTKATVMVSFLYYPFLIPDLFWWVPTVVSRINSIGFLNLQKRPKCLAAHLHGLEECPWKSALWSSHLSTLAILDKGALKPGEKKTL